MSRVNSIVCDKCGKKIDYDIRGFWYTGWFSQFNDDNDKDVNYDLCPECYSDVDRVIRENIIPMPHFIKKNKEE